jgi:hypothetical protein
MHIVQILHHTKKYEVKSKNMKSETKKPISSIGLTAILAISAVAMFITVASATTIYVSVRREI